ncbi:MFS transporter [Thalassiella azotivora]
MTDAPAPRRRAYLVWGVGIAAYVVAVLHRTSLGVAGIAAADRFDAGASVVASFAVLQLLVYAAMQIPIGVLLDRFGSRALVTVGAFTMAVGQLLLALAETVPAAMAARVLVGTGDAMTFVAVLRLVPAWFPARRVPVLTQVTGLTGQLGQILSAVPLVAILQLEGWTAAFSAAAALGVLVGVLAGALLRDTPDTGSLSGPPAPISSVVADVRSAWLHPGTRLGMWTHFTTQFSGTVFALLWGYPFLVSGQGLSAGQASLVLSLLVGAGIVVGPVLGVLVSRHPLRRSWLVLGVVGVNAAVWTAVLAWPGPAPVWLLALLVLALATSGPGSMIGFDFARTFNPPNRLGTATGIVNVGGFVASLVTIFLVGLVLDLRTGGAPGYDLDDFRVAMSVQFLMWAVGVTGVVVARRKVRRRMAAAGVVVPPIREAIARRRAHRRPGS